MPSKNSFRPLTDSIVLAFLNIPSITAALFSFPRYTLPSHRTSAMAPKRPSKGTSKAKAPSSSRIVDIAAEAAKLSCYGGHGPLKSSSEPKNRVL